MRTTLLGMARGDGGHGPPLMPSVNGGGVSAADRLLKISGMTREEYLEKFARRNVLSYGRWSPQAARRKGYKLRMELKGRIIVLGKETWRALWMPWNVEFFDHVWCGDREFILLPHPSGRNLLTNDPEIRSKMRRELREER